MWPPPVISWFRFAPVTIVISTINHSEIGVMCTNFSRDFVAGASHCSKMATSFFHDDPAMSWAPATSYPPLARTSLEVDQILTG